jgi:hypothetical protein
MIDDFSITVSELEAERVRKERVGAASAAARERCENIESAKAESRRLRDQLDAMHVSEADQKRGEEACAAKYDNAWIGFGPLQQARLIKAYLKGGFPE